jgi:hypothetical protein
VKDAARSNPPIDNWSQCQVRERDQPPEADEHRRRNGAAGELPSPRPHRPTTRWPGVLFLYRDASTRGSNVRGAWRRSRFSSASTSCSRSMGLIRPCHRALQRFPAAMDVSLDLRYRDPQRRRDLLVGHVLEVEEHERNPLMIRKRPHRPLEVFLTRGLLDRICRRGTIPWLMRSSSSDRSSSLKTATAPDTVRGG